MSEYWLSEIFDLSLLHKFKNSQHTTYLPDNAEMKILLYKWCMEIIFDFYEEPLFVSQKTDFV